LKKSSFFVILYTELNLITMAKIIDIDTQSNGCFKLAVNGNKPKAYGKGKLSAGLAKAGDDPVPPTVEYKNNLVAENSDYLKTENISITKISDVHFKQKLDIDLAKTAVGSILSFGISGNYFYLNVNTSNFISIDGIDDLGNNFFTSGSVINGTELIEFDGVRLYIDGVVDIDLSSFGELPFVTNSPFFLSRIAYQTSRYYSGSISSFELQGETFALNEPSGATFYGSKGTTGTRQTSNPLGLEYIDNVMIKPVDPVEYKNNLVAANSDYLETNKAVLVGEELKFSFSMTEGYIMTNNEYILGAASLSLRSFINWTTGGVIAIGCSVSSLKIDGSSVIVNTDLRLHRGSLIEVILTASVNDAVTKIGVASGGTLNINGSFNDFTINDETFALNEPSGATFYGSKGTTGTRQTSNPLGLEYIDTVMINRVDPLPITCGDGEVIILNTVNRRDKIMIRFAHDTINVNGAPFTGSICELFDFINKNLF
jgi:hypothetical protein